MVGVVVSADNARAPVFADDAGSSVGRVAAAGGVVSHQWVNNNNALRLNERGHVEISAAAHLMMIGDFEQARNAADLRLTPQVLGFIALAAALISPKLFAR